MTRFAEKTSVPVAKSRAEIEQLVGRAGASEFASMLRHDCALIAFRAGKRAVRFVLPLPARADRRFTHYTNRGSVYARKPEQAEKAWEQECRRAWRALALVIRAKLEAVSSGITTFEHEFLANIVGPTGRTMGEEIVPNLDRLPPTSDGLLLQIGIGAREVRA